MSQLHKGKAQFRRTNEQSSRNSEPPDSKTEAPPNVETPVPTADTSASAMSSDPHDLLASVHPSAEQDSSLGNSNGSSQNLPGRETSPRAKGTKSDPPTPPLTLDVLAELELCRIMQNHQLRHDINFDLNLHFRPNNDTEKGSEKVRKIQRFWQVTEIAFTNLAAGNDPEALRQIQTVLVTIREIVKSLVPEVDHGTIDDRLDTRLLLQQLEKKQLDFPQLAHWLSNLLRTHCAPMRDVMVMRMVSLVETGSSNGETRYLVYGLKELFGILECMKLDIANHQIRSLQPLLLDETISFEQKGYAHQLKEGKCILKDITEWHKDRIPLISEADFEVQRGTSRSESRAGEKMAEFFSVFVHTICWANKGKDLPTSAFSFDVERIKAIRNEIEDLVFLQQSVDFYRGHTKDYTNESENESMQRMRSLLCAPQTSCVRNRRTHDIGPVCLEIARHSSKPCSVERLQGYECELDQLICNDRTVREAVYHELLQTTFHYAEKYNALSPRAILASWNPAEMRRIHSHHSFVVHDIARRSAHMGILHWKVWGPGAYTPTLGEQDDTSDRKENF